MYIGEADSQEPYAVFMLDATNAFNKLNRPQALARARKLWPSGCLYSYNSYRGPVTLLLRSADTHRSKWIEAQTGVTQGCGLAGQLFSLGIKPLLDSLQPAAAPLPRAAGLGGDEVDEDEPASAAAARKRLLAQTPAAVARQKHDLGRHVAMGYADDIQGAGKVSACVRLVRTAQKEGPAFGIELNVPKCKLLVDPANVQATERVVAESRLALKVVTSARSLGAVIGPLAAREAYLAEMVAAKADDVRKVAAVAPNNPHAVYYVHTVALQPTWTFVQRVVKCEDAAATYAPLEQAIRTTTIPRVTGWGLVLPADREMLALPVRNGGMAIGNPVETSVAHYAASDAATAVLQVLQMEGSKLEPELVDAHNKRFGEVTGKCKQERRAAQAKKAEALGRGLAQARAAAAAPVSGAGVAVAAGEAGGVAAGAGSCWGGGGGQRRWAAASECRSGTARTGCRCSGTSQRSGGGGSCGRCGWRGGQRGWGAASRCCTGPTRGRARWGAGRTATGTRSGSPWRGPQARTQQGAPEQDRRVADHRAQRVHGLLPQQARVSRRRGGALQRKP